MNKIETPDMSWLLVAFNRSALATTPTIVCCPEVEIPGFHAAAIALAHKHQYIIIDVGLGEDPREAVFEKIGRASNIAVAVETKLASTKRDIFLVIRDADRLAAGEDGLAALWSLKSARDLVGPRLRILFFGSDRSALGSFVSPKSAPFFNSKVLEC
jgi:hypothetical protein